MAKSPAIGLALIDSDDVTFGNVLGEGGFSTVYMATHVNWGRVAVKRLANFRLTDISHQKEAEKMLRSLTSPYLVRIMGLIENPKGVDIVMEFFENGSLKEFEEKYMKCDCWARKIKMIQDIAYGMNFLHTLNPPITHCDLKLENVFVGNGFVAKIGDFGLAVSSSKSRQRAGSAGTISHMPPEAFESAGVEPDEAWDIYTFGLTTYELTTGRDPWPQLNTFANETLVSVWVGKGLRPNLESMPSDAPAEIVEIITSCWVAEPKERPRFINILKTVTELFETKYERSLRKADRAISDQMDLVQESTERKTQSVDSGWGSLEASSPKEKPNQTATPNEGETATRSNTDRDKDDLVIEKVKVVRENQLAIDPDASKDVKSTSREEENQPSDAACGVSGAVGGMESIGGLSLKDSNEAGNERDKQEDHMDVVLDKGLKWKYKHSLGLQSQGNDYVPVNSCKWIDIRHLAVCMKGCVRVYEVTTSTNHLAYTVTSRKWKPLLGLAKNVLDIAVSESLRGSMFVICYKQPYVYQLRCREASQEEKIYKIPGEIKKPSAIAANADVAVLSEYDNRFLANHNVVVCNLPDFTHQSTVQVGIYVQEISLNSEYLVLLANHKIIVRYSTGDMMKDLCKIEAPDNYEFRSVCFGNLNDGGRELYASCQLKLVGYKSVFKYILEESKEGQMQYRCVGRVVKGDQEMIAMGQDYVSLSSDQMMAFTGDTADVLFYTLE